MSSFLTTTGYGLETVEVSYEYDDDTNTVDFKVTWQGKEVSGLLSDDQNGDIEADCYTHQRKLDKIEAENCKLDRGQARYEELQGAMV